MSARRVALTISIAMGVVLTLAACAIGKPLQRPTTYIVDPPMTETRPAATRRLDTLRMGNVRVAAAYGGNALVYRMDEPGAVALRTVSRVQSRARRDDWATGWPSGSIMPARSSLSHNWAARSPRRTSLTLRSSSSTAIFARGVVRGGTGRAVRADRRGRRCVFRSCCTRRTSPVASSRPTHRPMRWCAGTARRSQKSSRSSFQISAP